MRVLLGFHHGLHFSIEEAMPNLAPILKVVRPTYCPYLGSTVGRSSK